VAIFTGTDGIIQDQRAVGLHAHVRQGARRHGKIERDSAALDWFAAEREALLEGGSGGALASGDKFAAGVAIVAAGFGAECRTNLRQP